MNENRMGIANIIANYKETLFRYIGNLPYHIKNKKFHKYIAEEKKRGRDFAVVDGSNETYLFDINDVMISSKMFSMGKTYSEDEIRIFFRMTEKFYGFTPHAGDIFLDIGANIGTTSVYVAKVYRKELQVISFEPDPYNYKFLRINSLINDCENIRVENIGLSDKTERKHMIVFSENRGKNRMESPASGPLSQGKETIEVETIRLDDYINKKNIEKADIKYIWIDAEGYEPYVVAGMSDLLRDRKIPLFMEFSYDIMSEKMYQLLYDSISVNYKNYISISMQTGKKEKHKITDLSDLYYNTAEQYNLFFY